MYFNMLIWKMEITQLYEKVSYIMRYASSIRLLEKHIFKCQGNANDHRIVHMHIIHALWCRDFFLLESPLVKDWVCSSSFLPSQLNTEHLPLSQVFNLLFHQVCPWKPKLCPGLSFGPKLSSY